jgi:hypothetical protein
LLTVAATACRLNYYPNAGKDASLEYHRRKGNCAEIVASAMYLQVHGTLPWYNSNTPARIVAVGHDGTVQSPCSTEDTSPNGEPQVSCLLWVKWQEMDTIRRGTELKKVSVQPKKVSNPSLQDVWKMKATSEF